MSDNVFQIEEKNGRVSIRLPGNIKKENILQMENRIDELVRNIGKNGIVVVQLSDVKYLSSLVIDVIMHIRRTNLMYGGKMFLTDVSEKCLDTLEALKLDQVLTICKNEDEIK